MDLPNRAQAMLEEQKHEWDLLGGGYDSLARVQTRTFDFGGFNVELHFNPGRIASSAAKVDAESIRRRPCFLCPQNRPSAQRAIDLQGDLVLLCNPFPIFPEHFTIPTRTHAPQRVRGIFRQMLDLARRLAPRYTVFYNGPQSGASAPDHLHLQAGNVNFTPTDREYPSLPKRTLVQTDELLAVAVEGYLRRMIAMESWHADALVRSFERLHTILDAVPTHAQRDEPMLNVFATFGAGGWRIIIFPRARHRPAAYFADGDARLLLSPGAVDMAGAVIVPVQRDFDRITPQDLVEMYDEVTISPEHFAAATEQFQRQHSAVP